MPDATSRRSVLRAMVAGSAGVFAVESAPDLRDWIDGVLDPRAMCQDCEGQAPCAPGDGVGPTVEQFGFDLSLVNNASEPVPLEVRVETSTGDELYHGEYHLEPGDSATTSPGVVETFPVDGTGVATVVLSVPGSPASSIPLTLTPTGVAPEEAAIGEVRSDGSLDATRAFG